MSSERRPADQAEREVIRGVRDATLFVSAGAGSGKTNELVARIVGLVAAGADLRQMAAITFTNAAAAELRDRVRFELGLAGSGKKYDFTEGQRANCREGLDVIDAAAIQTLHSFAQGVLALYPIQAGLPPEVAVRDEVGASIAFQERWDRFLEDLLKDGGGNPSLERPLIYGLGLGLTTTHLRKIAWQFHQDWDRVLPATFEHPPMPRISAAEIIPLLEEAVELKRENTNETDKAYGLLSDIQLERLLADLKDAQHALEASVSENERLAAEERVAGLLARQKLEIGPRTGNRANWRSGALSSLRQVTAAAETLRTDMLNELRGACLGPLLTAIQGFVREYRDERIRQGTLEFHDMLYLARDLLRRDTTVRLAVGRRFKRLLIDEFQDTDPIQIEIAVLVASSDPGAGEKHWSEVNVEPGRLFFVGDPKQSIYRFRRADIDLYQEASRRFGSGSAGRSVHLVQNFRSVPSVIAWSNHVFERLFELERKGGDVRQVEFEALRPYREGDGRPEPAVRVFGGPAPKGENIEYVRRVEAAAIAGVVSEIGDEGAGGAWLVGEDGGWRAPRFGDIAILLPTRTALPAIEGALNEAGIPCRIESRSLLFETQEVRDLLSILNAVDDPTDQVAFVAALRSPGFACSDEDLWQWWQAGGRWGPRSASDGYPTEGSVARAMETLREWNRQRWWLEPAELIDMVLRERRLFQLAFAARRPRDSWQRLRFVHEQARAFQLAGGRGLRQFVQYMERQADEQARLTETAIAEHDDDAVRIMTVHASKGLEFPIVILAGLAKGENPQSPVMLWSGAGGPEVRVGNQGDGYFETRNYEALKASEDAMERLEDDRLLYVAATRARDHLVVSTFHKDKNSKKDHLVRHASNECSPAECLYAICQEAPEGLLTFIEPGQPRRSATSNADGNGPRDSAADREAWSAARKALIAATARRPALAATSVARFLPNGAEETDAKEEQMEEEAPWKKGRAGTSVGRAVHAVLQTIDLETGEGIDAAARAQSIAEGVEDRFSDILAYASAALRSRTVREAVASGRYWREVYVSAQVEGAALEGFIDLLYQTPRGLVVVDYKTDAVRNEAAIEEAMGHYRLQGGAYALALAEALGRPVDRCVFVFAQAEREREIVDIASAIEEVRGLIPAAMAAAGV